MKTLICSAVLMAGVLIASSSAYAELALIAHPGNPTEALTKRQVKRIYLGKDRSFPGGGKVTAVDQDSGSAAREQFYARVIKRSASKLNAYWSKRMFAGKGTPPKTVGDDSAVKAWITKHPDGLGYVDTAVLDGSVKVLLVVP